MSSRLRYYKSKDVTFRPIAVIVDDSKYINLIDAGLDNKFYETIKEVIKDLSSNKIIKDSFDALSKDAVKEPYLIINMNKNTPEVDGYKTLGDGDKDNILHYCKSALIFLNRQFKPYLITFNFANMAADDDFRSAKYYGSDKSIRFGSGAMSALEYFTNKCTNKELSEYIVSNHIELEILW